MSREMIKEIAKVILETKQDYPLRVGIDGIDAAGKKHRWQTRSQHT